MTKETFSLVLTKYKKAQDNLLKFENNMEAALGPDSSVMCCFLLNDFTEAIQHILFEEGENEAGLDWFLQELDKIASGEGASYWVTDNIRSTVSEYTVKSFEDYYDAIHDTLEPAKIYDKDEFEKEHPVYEPVDVNLKDIMGKN